MTSPAPNKPSEPKRTANHPRIFKKAAVVCGVVLAVLFFAVLWQLYDRYLAPKPDKMIPDLRSLEESMILQRTAAQLLAGHIQSRYDKPRILVIAPPDDETLDMTMEKVGLDALLSGLDGVADEIIVETPEVDPDALPLVNLWFRAETLDAIVARHADADVVVTTIGLPPRIENITFWRKRPRPDLMVLNDQVYRLENLIRESGIQAIVTRRPMRMPPDELPPPTSPEYWLLITPDNVDTVRARHKNLFVESDTPSTFAH